MDDTRRGRKAIDVIAVSFVVLLVVIPQYYLAVAQPDEDWTVFVWAVALPAIVGSATLLALGKRVYFFIFMAYFWSVTDDNPVNLDSIYTWPEVTHGLHHTVAEVILHVLTLLFLYLAVREAVRDGGKMAYWRLSVVSLLTVAAFVTASVSIIPIPSLQASISANWYQIDAIAHVVSLVLISAALWEAMKR